MQQDGRSLDAGKDPKPWRAELNPVSKQFALLGSEPPPQLNWEILIGSSGELQASLKPPPLGAQQSWVSPRLLDPTVVKKN